MKTEINKSYKECNIQIETNSYYKQEYDTTTYYMKTNDQYVYDMFSVDCDGYIERYNDYCWGTIKEFETTLWKRAGDIKKISHAEYLLELI